MSDIKSRFFKAFEYLKDIGKIKNLQEFSEITGTNKAGISDIKADRKKISLDNLVQLVGFAPEIAIEWLTIGSGSMIKSDFSTDVRQLKVSESETVLQRMPSVVTTDNEGRDNIALVPVKAAAGYLNGYGDPEYIGQLPTYSLPNIANGTFRMFQVKGDSMTPTLHDQSMVVGQFVENWVKDIKDDRVYVIISRNDGIIVKRCLNRIKKYGNLYCKSDNRKEYPEPIILHPEDIIEVWEYKMHLAYHLPNPAELHDRVSDLEAEMNFIKNQFMKSLSK